MKWTLCGGGQRAAYLAAELQQHGHDVISLNPGGCAPVDWARHVAWAECVVLPIPTRTVIWQPGDPGLSLVMRAVRPGSTVFGAFSGQIPGMYANSDINVINILENPDFKHANALPTAEGCIARMLPELGRTIEGSKILVTGNGEAGRAVCGKLQALNADVYLWSRRGGEELAAGPYDAVINTIPKQIFTGDILKALPVDCLMVELASAPYGFDVEQAGQLGLRTLVLPGLPGMFPKTAAKLTAETLLKEYQK
ncbi:MAG: hypothetical protein FWD16_07730 [Clostridia bacterium]|nr:hypothetical protein [Clostridia bacterium]